MSSKKISARQIKTQENYNLVLNKSIELFNEQGYDQTTITDISRATGLSNGSIYHLFQGKDDMLQILTPYERISRNRYHTIWNSNRD